MDFFTFYFLNRATVDVTKTSCLLSKDQIYGDKGDEDEGPNSILGKHFGKWINIALQASY